MRLEHNIVQNTSFSPSSPTSTSPTIRVMSYNLLADLYTSQTSSPLWTYLPPKFLTIFYRLPQLIHEIISTQPTVILLQEVDQKHYRNYIYPVLKKLGYEGTFGKKYGNQTEGDK